MMAARTAQQQQQDGNRSSGGTSRSNTTNQPQEEIVGTLDAPFPDGVGSSDRKSAQLTVKDSEMSMLERAIMGGGAEGSAGGMMQERFYTEGYFSDSDSSREEGARPASDWNKRRPDASQELEPLVPSFEPQRPNEVTLTATIPDPSIYFNFQRDSLWWWIRP